MLRSKFYLSLHHMLFYANECLLLDPLYANFKDTATLIYSADYRCIYRLYVSIDVCIDGYIDGVGLRE